jgi:hypothetical protein
MVKHDWLWWRQHDVAVEKEQMGDEGRDPAALAAEFAALEKMDDNTQAFQDAFNTLMDRVQAQPSVNEDDEPSDLAGIQAARPNGPRQVVDPGCDLGDRLHGAWLGRCAGCLLGKPIENWSTWRTWKLWGILRDGGKEMLTDYIWRLDIDEAIFAKHDGVYSLPMYKGINYMPEDDDLNYTVTGLALVKQKGLGFTPDDVATFWLQNIPILHTYTAERAAYRNFVSEICPAASASFRNPYREWIGAQIRADFFGYVAPGNPALAAELAWRDACISHVRNGIYGEMWVAAMLAAAAVETNVVKIMEAGLGEIPARCRLAEDIRQVMRWHADGVSYKNAVAKIHQRWDETKFHHWCHTNSNAQIVALGLLYGEGDYEKTITHAVYPVLDTDCNGATAGSVIGMALGAKALPAKWTDVLNDTLLTGVDGYHRVSISSLAQETLALAVRPTAKPGKGEQS